MTKFFFLLSRFFSCLWLSPFFTMICLLVNLYVFILLGIHWISWMCRLLFFNKFGKFFFSAPFSPLLSFQYFYCVYTDMLDGFPYFSEAAFIFLHSFCSLFFSWHIFYLFIFRFTNFSSVVQIYIWASLVNF